LYGGIRAKASAFHIAKRHPAYFTATIHILPKQAKSRMQLYDFMVIGAGIIGLNVARELKRRHPDAKIAVLEKEPAPGKHASGRNSGVLHAGFYYTADSLKAKFTRDGNRALHAYCDAKNIPLNRCGKLVVARNDDEDKLLDELMARGQRNGVELNMISVDDARKIEPRVKTQHRALYSPSTASADPMQVLLAVEQDARAEGIDIHYDAPCNHADRSNTITTPQTRYQAGYLINAAGLYADRIARYFGFSQHYAILPFKGLYMKSSEPPGSLRTNIYPVPDLKNPFLGVHFTLQADGHIKIGPTAIPALWREQYSGLSGFKFDEFVEISLRSLGLLVHADFAFRKLAITELQKYQRRVMVEQAQTLAHGVELAQYRYWGKPGIRAQLLNTQTRKLEMDFVLEGDDKSLHILNAVSPGWTCAIPFSAYICDKIEKKH
jgi:(S)-2-hydroxyglutarate dehydrogenase